MKDVHLFTNDNDDVVNSIEIKLDRYGLRIWSEHTKQENTFAFIDLNSMNDEQKQELALMLLKTAAAIVE